MKAISFATMDSGDALALQVAGNRRLIITDMVLENFKSYAGVQHVGPFHKVGVRTARIALTLVSVCWSNRNESHLAVHCQRLN